MKAKHTEAMKQALEALEGLEALLLSMGLTHLIVYGDAEKAITALREALASEAIEQPAPGSAHYEDGDVFERIAARKAQPAQQEPVAWISKHGVVYPLDAKDEVHPINELQPLYTSPPAQQEPVAGVVLREGLPTLLQDRNIKSTDQRLYTSPPAPVAKPHEQSVEPLEYWNAVEGWVKIDEVREHFDSVGCGTIYKTPGDGRVPLTTAHRTWVGLTDEEITDIWAEASPYYHEDDFARAIEAKLKQRNT